jgi:hypothetical protein
MSCRLDHVGESDALDVGHGAAVGAALGALAGGAAGALCAARAREDDYDYDSCGAEPVAGAVVAGVAGAVIGAAVGGAIALFAGLCDDNDDY